MTNKIKWCMSLVMIISVLLSASYGVFGTIRVLVDDALIKFPDAQPFIDESNLLVFRC